MVVYASLTEQLKKEAWEKNVPPKDVPILLSKVVNASLTEQFEKKKSLEKNKYVKFQNAHALFIHVVYVGHVRKKKMMNLSVT